MYGFIGNEIGGVYPLLSKKKKMDDLNG